MGQRLRNYREQHPQGNALDGTLPEQYVNTHDSRCVADPLIWTGLGRRPNRRRDLPTIVVEFVSRDKCDRQRDYVKKRAEYLALGIQEYWVVDGFRRILTVFRRDVPDVIVVAESKVYRPELRPGFELSVGRLLSEAGEWERSED
ncbi:MAG: Uma2 family endonuclease [Isosphaeraceae bacterium]|nr:Uma2 family endonuclease [Isosphaeraceae bacterium]